MTPSTRPPSSRRAPRILPWLGGCLLALLGLGAFGVHRGLEAARTKYEPQLAALREDATRNVDFFCEQQEVLAADPWFHEPRTEGDAGPLLNAWVTWDPKPVRPKDSPLAIPAHLPQRQLKSKRWLTDPVDVSGLDFGWMARLHAYDRWDLLRNTPVPQPERIDWVNAPVPDLVPIQLWAKYRLLRGLRSGQPLEAARDVRHLAWLLYRTDSLLGGAVATSLLQAERDAYDSLPNPPAGWRPMSRMQVERMRGLLMSGFAFSSLVVPPEVARKARRCGEPAVGRCITMAEVAFLAKYVQPFAQDTYREAYTALEEDLAAFPCATSLTGDLWERGVSILDSKEGLSEHPRWLWLLPRGSFGRDLTGMVLASNSPGLKYLHAFREKLTASESEGMPGAPVGP